MKSTKNTNIKLHERKYMSCATTNSTSMTNPYGGTQDSYLQRSVEAVKKGLTVVAEARRQEKDLQQVFFSLIDTLAENRKEIAKAHGTKKAWYFGRQRMHFSHDINHTCLDEKNGVEEHYKAYNQRMLTFLQGLIQGAIPLQGDPQQKKIRVEGEHEGRKCSFELELLTAEDLRKRHWNGQIHPQIHEAVDRLNLKAIPNSERIDEKDFPSTENDQSLLAEIHGNAQKLKKAYPAIHVQQKMNYMLKDLAKTFPSPEKIFKADGSFSHLVGDSANLKNIFLLGKVRIEIEGKMYALSEYLTWTYQDYQTDPVARLQRSSIVIIHQDRYLIEPTLKEVSQLFKKALQWEQSSGDLKDLKAQVALIRYLFAHAMPYVRGSAAIGEWLEEVIYRERGLDFKRVEGKSGDLEAFIAPMWSAYPDQYQATIKVAQKSAT